MILVIVAYCGLVNCANCGPKTGSAAGAVGRGEGGLGIRGAGLPALQKKGSLAGLEATAPAADPTIDKLPSFEHLNSNLVNT